MTDPVCPPDPPATPAPTAAPQDTPVQKLRKLALLLRAAEYLYDHDAFTKVYQTDFFKAIDEIIPRPTPTEEPS